MGERQQNKGSLLSFSSPNQRMSEISISGSSIPLKISTTFAVTRYKTMSPARLPITQSPCLTIPSGFSSGALLESPALLMNMKVEPSPTAGTFGMPLIVNNGGLTALDSPKDSSKGLILFGTFDFSRIKPKLEEFTTKKNPNAIDLISNDIRLSC